MLAGLQAYEGFPLKNVDDPGLDLPQPAAAGEAAPAVEFDALTARFKARLGERVTEVRASDRLVDSPLRLVSPGAGRQHEMDRVRRMLEKDFSVPAKIVELNRSHPLIRNLARLAGAGQAEAVLDACIEQLYENGLLLEGLHPNPAEMVGRIQALMEAATESPKS
jgi:molecular chaperone HtpG